SEEGPITLSGLSATGDGDDTLSATLSGIPAGWTVRDGAVVLSNEIGRAACREGVLVVAAPDQGGENAVLTLTVSTAEGGGTSAVVELNVAAGVVGGLEVSGVLLRWQRGGSDHAERAQRDRRR